METELEVDRSLGPGFFPLSVWTKEKVSWDQLAIASQISYPTGFA